jgi:hypothetical protein
MIMYWGFNSWQIKLKDNFNQGSHVYLKEANICLEIKYIYSVQVNNEPVRGSGVSEPYDDISIND